MLIRSALPQKRTNIHVKCISLHKWNVKRTLECRYVLIGPVKAFIFHADERVIPEQSICNIDYLGIKPMILTEKCYISKNIFRFTLYTGHVNGSNERIENFFVDNFDISKNLRALECILLL